MPAIFEAFGYPITDQSAAAQESRRLAICPFMAQPCDGGGNRHLSAINLQSNPTLKRLWPSREMVHSGVCSIQPAKDGVPWIVCPRRLLVLGREISDARVCQKDSEKRAVGLLKYPKGTRLGVWPEVKLKYITAQTNKAFDYAFDYIIMPIGRASASEIQTMTGREWDALKPLYERGGYTIAKRGGQHYVEDGPLGRPSVIEIMTSSTSGGDKAKRSTIPMAFEDAMLGRPHQAPGINYRQVWARMVSQLIVKSEVAIEWGGTAIWVVQDVLVNYIATSTGLNIKDFLAEKTSEVNMLSFSYGNAYKDNKGVIELSNPALFAGPIGPQGSKIEPSFQDMIRAPVCPPLSYLLGQLARRKPANELVAV